MWAVRRNKMSILRVIMMIIGIIIIALEMFVISGRKSVNIFIYLL